MLRIFTPVKIERLRPGLNPQTWVPEASMLTTRSPKPSRAVKRRGSAAPRCLGLRVQIPQGAWISVFCDCCMLSGRGLCDGPITRPEDLCLMCMCRCV